MIKEIFSAIALGKLLHIVHKPDGKGRVEIVPPKNSLQLASCSGYRTGHNFKGPHRHLSQSRSTDRTQESIIVFSGGLEVEMFDLNDKFLEKAYLGPGDCYVDVAGGHSLRIAEPRTRFYSIKNGPFQGNDKEFFKKR
jgi:hypothetical protein